ncbi:MAG: CheR family methyltransferase [Spirochaetota bacterium]
MAFQSTITTLTDEDFDFFREVVYTETGIKLAPLKRALLQSRIMKRLRALGLTSFHDYRLYLDDDYDNEILEFINVITTNKTEFMRESRHFDFMLQTALPELEKTCGDELRIWSAGCSTGEEPYSIAITCREYFRSRTAPTVKILATDIDTQVLKTGYVGEYKSALLNIFDEALRTKYFDYSDGMYIVREDIRKMVSFRRLNLLLDTYPMKKRFKIIFCRNVIIYFDKETQNRLFKKMYNYLDDDGYLFIGHSENLSGISDRFRSIGHTIYKKIV